MLKRCNKFLLKVLLFVIKVLMAVIILTIAGLITFVLLPISVILEISGKTIKLISHKIYDYVGKAINYLTKKNGRRNK